MLRCEPPRASKSAAAVRHGMLSRNTLCTEMKQNKLRRNCESIHPKMKIRLTSHWNTAQITQGGRYLKCCIFFASRCVCLRFSSGELWNDPMTFFPPVKEGWEPRSFGKPTRRSSAWKHQRERSFAGETNDRVRPSRDSSSPIFSTANQMPLLTSKWKTKTGCNGKFRNSFCMAPGNWCNSFIEKCICETSSTIIAVDCQMAWIAPLGPKHLRATLVCTQHLNSDSLLSGKMEQQNVLRFFGVPDCWQQSGSRIKTLMGCTV